MTTAVDRLTGRFVTLAPYLRGFVPRETLGTLWTLAQKEGVPDKVFHVMQDGDNPVSIRGDLVAWCRYFDPVEPGTRIVSIVQSHADLQPAGMVWLDDLAPGHRCNYNLWLRRKSWGPEAREATFLACRYAFEVLGFKQVWGMTPWRTAARNGEAVGARLVATLPGYCLTAQGIQDLLVLRLDAHDLVDPGEVSHDGRG